MPKRSEKKIREEQVAAVRLVMSTVGGRQFVLRLMEDVCGIYKSVFRFGAPGSDVMHEERLAVNGAKQAIGQWLREEAKACAPIEFERMYLEAETQKAVEAQMDNAAKAGPGEMEEDPSND
jgi:hypothetical protein